MGNKSTKLDMDIAVCIDNTKEIILKSPPESTLRLDPYIPLPSVIIKTESGRQTKTLYLEQNLPNSLIYKPGNSYTDRPRLVTQKEAETSNEKDGSQKSDSPKKSSFNLN